jgi:trehalose 6-phosphate phosphatase
MTSLPEPPPALIERASLFLDFDGTLADFVSPRLRPDFGDDARDLIARLAERLDGRLAIISGRSLDNLIETVGIDTLELSGSHGLERRAADGRRLGPQPAEAIEALHQSARDFAGSHSGLFVEEKPTGVALHYRERPAARDAVEAYAGRLAGSSGCELRLGQMVAEVRVRGPHKGDAVELLMSEPPFADGRPLFVGDDLTDEDGFLAAHHLGGDGILVGPARPTAARYRLPTVAAVWEWLAS